jgi:hypothetical protein
MPQTTFSFSTMSPVGRAGAHRLHRHWHDVRAWVPGDRDQLVEESLHLGLVAFGADRAGAGDLPLGRRRIVGVRLDLLAGAVELVAIDAEHRLLARLLAQRGPGSVQIRHRRRAARGRLRDPSRRAALAEGGDIQANFPP